MPDVPKHAWTHRPRSQGGTDPIEITAEVASDTPWATAAMFSQSITKSGGYYTARFETCGTNRPDIFELTDISGSRASWLAINEHGYYVAYFAVQVFNEYWGANYTILEPIYNDGGGATQINVSYDAYSGWTGADYARQKEQFADEAQASPPDHKNLWEVLTFNYDPDGLDDWTGMSPLEIAVRVNSAKTDAIEFGAYIHVQRIAGPGYTLQDVTV